MSSFEDGMIDEGFADPEEYMEYLERRADGLYDDLEEEVVDPRWGDWSYRHSSGGVIVTHYSGTDAAVAIPPQIASRPVISIGPRAFCGCKTLVSLTIPDSVLKIGESAFAFCPRLNHISIPANVADIGRDAFHECGSLSDIMVDASNKCYSSVCGVLLDQVRKTVIQCPGGKSDACALPEGTLAIADRAFWNCSRLPAVIIPDGVTQIGKLSFRGCADLISVTIPMSVKTIGESAFTACARLSSLTVHPANLVYRSVNGVLYEHTTARVLHCPEGTCGTCVIPQGCLTIGRGAFWDCSKLFGVIIPEGVTTIEDLAFTNCSALVNVTIPDSVTRCGVMAFEACTSLTTVTIGRNLMKLGVCMFHDCVNLKEVYFRGNAPTTSGASGTFTGAPNVIVYHLPEKMGWGDSLYHGRPSMIWAR